MRFFTQSFLPQPNRTKSRPNILSWRLRLLLCLLDITMSISSWWPSTPCPRGRKPSCIWRTTLLSPISCSIWRGSYGALSCRTCNLISVVFCVAPSVLLRPSCGLVMKVICSFGVKMTHPNGFIISMSSFMSICWRNLIPPNGHLCISGRILASRRRLGSRLP